MQGGVFFSGFLTRKKKFISEHMQDVPEKLQNRAISTIPGVVTPSVKTCRSSDRVIDALAQMVAHDYSALGIEDVESANRQIVSIVTIKDVGHAMK